MKKNPILVAVLVILCIVTATQYNSLNASSVNVDRQFAQADNELNRRAELIPKLVNIVKGYAAHENKVLTAVTEARSGVSSAKTPDQLDAANAKLTSTFNMVVESYPNLKADKQFMALFRENVESDNRITQAKRDYNNATTAYNLKVTSFPANIFAKIFAFEKRDVFKTDEAAKANPKVEF